MSAPYVLSRLAEQDIEEVATYIAQENKQAACDFVDAIYDSLSLLAENPMMGHTREDITQHSVRFWTFKWHYMVVYMPERPLKVVRVLSGRRDFSDFLV